MSAVISAIMRWGSSLNADCCAKASPNASAALFGYERAAPGI
jgi:hypothetical protein